jgi:hypothetical protein
MQLSAYRLLLYPVQDCDTAIRPVLDKQGMLGNELGGGVFSAGENFLDHICFLGCSPDIELEPQTGKAFCYVQLPVGDELITFQPVRKPLLPLRHWVIVGNIHESEAIPDAALLDALETASGCRWKFAYLKP